MCRASLPTWCFSASMGPSWSTTTGCTAIVSPMVLCVERSWPTLQISLTGPALRPGRWPNVVVTLVPGLCYIAGCRRHFLCTDVCISHRVCSPSTGSLSSRPVSRAVRIVASRNLNQGLRGSVVLRQRLLCARFHQTSGGDRPCQCRCRISPNKISLWIQIHSLTWSRASCTQRHQGPGCRHLAMIWQNLTRRILVLLCPVLQRLTSCQWCL